MDYGAERYYSKEMTKTTEVEWEELDSLDQLKLDDEVEYKCLGSNREYRYWGKVIDIQRNLSGGTGEISLVRLEGDWTLVPSSFNAYDTKNLVTRKVVPLKFPTEAGSVITYGYRDDTLDAVTYVRIDDRADKAVWVMASNGERWAEWELELIHNNDTLTVVSDGS